MKFPFLRKSTSESLAISMAGIKLGDRLLVVGCGEPALIAQLAAKTGLTGRACAVDDNAQVVGRAAEIALREGALVETSVSPLTSLSLDSASFDVAVVNDVLPRLASEQRAPVLGEVRRVLRAGGRCLVIDSAPGALSALVRASSRAVDHVSLLQAAGFKASRVLAERNGQIFAEAVNPSV